MINTRFALLIWTRASLNLITERADELSLLSLAWTTCGTNSVGVENCLYNFIGLQWTRMYLVLGDYVSFVRYFLDMGNTMHIVCCGKMQMKLETHGTWRTTILCSCNSLLLGPPSLTYHWSQYVVSVSSEVSLQYQNSYFAKLSMQGSVLQSTLAITLSACPCLCKKFQSHVRSL